MQYSSCMGFCVSPDTNYLGMCFLISTQPVFSEPQAGLQAGLVAGSWNGQERGEGGEEGCGLLARSTSLVTCGDPVQVVSELDAGEGTH